jgi:hypothetical protein
MIRSKKLFKTLPLFLLLTSTASVASASDLADKLRSRVENAKSAAANAVKESHPARNADRGDRDRGRGRDGHRDRGRYDNDRRGRGGDAHRDRGRDNRRWDNDRGRSDNRRWDNDRRDGRRWDNDRGRSDGRRWDNDRRHDRHDGRRWDNDRRHDRRWDGDRRHGHYRPHYGHGYRHSGRHAWHGSRWRNGYYYQSGRFLNFGFSIPSFLSVDWPSRYDQYYYGNVYYPGLGDYVEVFLFPVYYGSYVEYVPYAYYDGQLYGRGRMLSGGPNISFHFDF